MELENIKYEKQGHICILTINRPPANSWNLAAMKDFVKALDAAEADKDVRVIVLTGEGRVCFSAGFDIKDSANSAQISPLGSEVWTRVDRFPKPVIAAINGHALGGGCELALACHFRIMEDNQKATIGLTELNLGIIPGWGGTQRLTRRIGRPAALDIILLGKRKTAPEALEIGLVDKIAPKGQVMDVALAFANELATRPPIAVRCVLEAISAGLYEGIDAGLAKEREGSGIVRDSKDAIEGFTAFLEKRPPVFTGE